MINQNCLQTSEIRNRDQNLEASSFFKSFFKTVAKKEKSIDDSDEAEEAAWEERKSLLKIFIRENMEAIDEKMKEESDQ